VKSESSSVQCRCSQCVDHIHDRFTVVKDALNEALSSPETTSNDTGKLAGIKEMHATSAGLKAYCTFTAAEGLEDCRKCCGGHGVMKGRSHRRNLSTPMPRQCPVAWFDLQRLESLSWPRITSRIAQLRAIASFWSCSARDFCSKQYAI
jgi:hypothetical protein